MKSGLENSAQDRVKSLLVDRFGIDPNKITSSASFKDDFGFTVDDENQRELNRLVMPFEVEFGIRILEQYKPQIFDKVRDVVDFFDNPPADKCY